MNALIDLAIGNIIYTGIVPKSQTIDNETETPLYADELENGMMVVLETDRRDDETQPYLEHREIPIRNRWCEVTKVRRAKGDTFFIGVYADGQKIFRQINNTAGFVVKNVSIPAKTVTEKRFRFYFSPGVYALVAALTIVVAAYCVFA